MKPTWEQAEGALLGLLVGDAVGVPYEFHSPRDLPPWDQLDMIPPAGFSRSYSHVPPGTWSDDGAQALCLLDSLIACGGWNAGDFAVRLLRWCREGFWAVDGKVFDIGIQTGQALDRLADGVSPARSGLSGERNNGNGSLMRTLPAVLVHRGSDEELVGVVEEQSAVTHAHPRSQVCCALYALWARGEIAGVPQPWDAAMEALRGIYPKGGIPRFELETHILGRREPPGGSGYVVDSLLSARVACEQATYVDVVRAAIAFGHDTDTTACVAGGIAGIRHGRAGIPKAWLDTLRGRDLLEPLLGKLREVRSQP